MKTSAQINLSYSRDDLAHEHRPIGRYKIIASEIKAISFPAELLLSEKQEADIRSILEAEKLTAELLIGQLDKNRRQLRIAVRSRLLDKERLQPLLSQRTQIESELIAAREHLKDRIYDVLTIDQRAVLDAKQHS